MTWATLQNVEISDVSHSTFKRVYAQRNDLKGHHIFVAMHLKKRCQSSFQPFELKANTWCFVFIVLQCPWWEWWVKSMSCRCCFLCRCPTRAASTGWINSWKRIRIDLRKERKFKEKLTCFWDFSSSSRNWFFQIQFLRTSFSFLQFFVDVFFLEVLHGGLGPCTAALVWAERPRAAQDLRGAPMVRGNVTHATHTHTKRARVCHMHLPHAYDMSTHRLDLT